MASFAENQGSRVFHLMMIVPAGLLLLLSLLSLGTLAHTNNDFLDEYDKKEPNGDANCILYAESGNQNRVKFQEDVSCSFSVAGGGILTALAVAFTVVLVVKALFGIGVFSLTALIELAMSAAGALWALIVASVITAGLNQTCQAYRDTFEDFGADKLPCCAYFYLFDLATIEDEGNVFFYDNLNTSRITAWIAMVLLIVLAGVYTFIIIRYFFGRSSSSKNTSSKSDSTAEKTNPI